MTLRAVVHLRDGIAADDAQSDALRGFVKAQLQPYKYPRLIEYVTHLPKTGTGKIDRQALLQNP
jgi:acyl-coenzyme A synthetase/AMP-(fatty) acid ligase